MDMVHVELMHIDRAIGAFSVIRSHTGARGHEWASSYMHLPRCSHVSLCGTVAGTVACLVAIFLFILATVVFFFYLINIIQL